MKNIYFPDVRTGVCACMDATPLASLFSLLLSRLTLTIRPWVLSLFKVRRLMLSLRRCPFWSRGTKNGTQGSVQLLLLFSKGYRSSCSMQSTMMQQISLSFSHVRIYIYANDIRLQVKWPEGKCKMCSNSSRGIYLTHISPCFEAGSEQQLEQPRRTTRRRISRQFPCFVCSLSIRRFWGKGEKWKRKRERGEGEKPFSSPPPPSPI